jgi:hypothetical protein
MAESAGFWSYVREDDIGDNGRILALAEDMQAQYRIQTAESLELFVDRRSTQWGDEWQKRINDAIAGTTFFLPVVTPSYFKSNACRQELLKFVREAERLGLAELLMPIYWVGVPDLDNSGVDSADEAIAVIAKYEWRDFRDVSFEDRSSSTYRKAVAELAQALASRAIAAQAIDDSPTLSAVRPEQPDELDEGPGLMEKLADAEEAMPKVVTVLGEVAVDMRRINELTNGVGDEISTASQRGQGMKAALLVTNRLASELETPAQDLKEHGREYAKALSELDPGVHARIDILEAAGSLDAEDRQFLEEQTGLMKASDEVHGTLSDLVKSASTLATFSRSLRKPLDAMQSGLQGILDGKAIIDEWGHRASIIAAQNEAES